MAVDKLIKEGDKLLADKDFLGAIQSYTEAIAENNKAFRAYLNRAIAYQRFKNYARAKTDISEAFALAQERGKRDEIGECYYRLGVLEYAEKDFKLAYKNLVKAAEFDSKDFTLQTWISKCERELQKSDPEFKKAEEAKEPAKLPSTSIEAINQHAPLKEKIRDDWYQSKEEVVITIYAKKVQADSFSIDFNDRSVSVSFPSGNGSEYNYNLEPLYGDIDAAKSSYAIKSTKVEITLVKKAAEKWPTLESSSEPVEESIVYPTSSKKAINWANFDVEDKEEESSDPNDFFAKLYKDVDDDTKKAMMKSYVESNGTVLTTDWKEAKEKTFETSPPDGMEARSWQ